jgi:hypothetical protein
MSSPRFFTQSFFATNEEEQAFETQALKICYGLAVPVNKGLFSTEGNAFLNAGIKMISALCRHQLYCFNNAEIENHINSQKGDIMNRLNGSQLIMAIRDNAIILNEAGTQAYFIEIGHFKKECFSVKINDADFLKNKQCDPTGKIIITQANTLLIADIIQQAKTAKDGSNRLSFEEKKQRLFLYTAGTLISTMVFDDIHRGRDGKNPIYGKPLYPHKAQALDVFDMKKTYKDIIKSVGAKVLSGELPFNVDLVNPSVFAELRSSEHLKNLLASENITSQPLNDCKDDLDLRSLRIM